MGLTAGAIGAFCGTPADVALIRMCVDNRLPEAERRNYKSVFDAWSRIVKEEGFTKMAFLALVIEGEAFRHTFD